MGNTRNTGYLQNAIKVSDAGAISFMSGSTMLATINTTGQMSGSSPVLFASTASFVANAQTASFVQNAQSASYILTAQTASFVANAQTASFVANAQTASFVALAQSASNAVSAQTASFANTFTVNSTLTAQTLVVQTITSSVDFVTGSTRFGSLLANTHQFTGSVNMTGSLALTGAATFSSTVTTTQLLLNESSPKITFTPLSYSGAYRTVLGTRSGAEGVLQLGNNNPNYIVGGNTGVGGSLHFYVNAISDFITSTNGTLALVLGSSGAAKFSSSVTAANLVLNTDGVYLKNRASNVNATQFQTWHNSVDTRRGYFGYGEGGANNLFLVNEQNANIYIGTNSTYNLTITSTGAATFSSSVTAASLTVGSLGSGSDAVISLATNASGSPRTIYYKASTAAINFTSTAGADLMSLTNGGSLGIGTTSPSSKLQIYGTDAELGIQIAKNGSDTVGGGPYIALQNLANSRQYLMQLGASNDLLLNYWGGAGYTERMRITSSGPINFGSITNYVSVGNDGGGVYMETVGSENARRAIRIQVGNSNASQYSSVSVDGANQLVRLSTSNTERMRIFSNGIINTGGVTHQYFAGSVAGNQSLTFTINCETMSSFRITCVMNHYGYISDYGCANMSLLANGPVLTVITVSNTSSGNGGSWSFTQVSHTQFTITKNAGSYGGGGNYFVEVVGNNSY